MSHALLLAAGRATRLGALREQYAKACVPVAGTTPLRFLLHAFADAGYEHLWINTHYRAEQVREQAEAEAPPSLQLHFLHEPTLLGTGGTLLHLYEQHGVMPEAVANAKMFCDFPFATLRHANPGTLVLHPASDLKVFGGLRFDPEQRVLGLQSREEAAASGESAAVFTGIYRPHQSWLNSLAEARTAAPNALLCSVRHGLLPNLQQAQALLHSGFWCEISTADRVQEAERLIRHRERAGDRRA